MHQVPGSTLARRGGLPVVALVLVLVAAACGGGASTAAPPSTVPPASTTSTSARGATTVVRGAPRWETVTTLKGTGATVTEPFTILADSIQWRARWSCDGPGQLRVTTDPPPRRPAPVIDEACPGKGERFAIVNGEVRLKVEAAGPWQIAVDQQVDSPLREPPFEGMASAPVLRQGTFYNIDKMAKGTARLYQRADGARVLRFEGFEVSTNIDLFVWLSEAASPKTTADAAAEGAPPHVVLGNLKSTLGDQNYVVPADVPTEKIKSIVIWCEPVRTVYGAATMA
jgi:hypothetical protein